MSIRWPSIVWAFVMMAPVASTGEPESAKVNPVVEKVMTGALIEAEKGYDAYRAILARVTDKAIKDLEKMKMEAMKKGDLSSANDLDALVKELRNGGLEKKIAERKNSAGDLLGDGAEIPASLVGKWSVVGMWGGIIELQKTGDVLGLHNGTTGKWRIEGRQLIVEWTHFKGGETYELTGKGDEYRGVHKNIGTGVSGFIRLVRMVEQRK